jgi:hypothetical protein
MSQFDNRKNLTLTADAPSYTAKIAPGAYSWSATISYKPGWKVGPPSVTAKDSDTLMGELTRLDSAVKFYKTGRDAGTLSAADAKALEAMRVDVANTSDAQYRSACRNFGQKPQPRPTQAAKTAPQVAVPFHVQGYAYGAFMQSHGELFVGVFAEQNAAIIAQWFQDENRQVDAASLEQAYRELKAANCFRTANTLTRDMNGNLQVVRPYDHAVIVAMRRQQVVDARDAAPSSLSEVDREAWNAVRAKYPQLSVNSAGFKKCCSDTILLWATEYLKEQHPELAAANKRGELRKAVDTVVMQWTRNPNLGQGNKTIKDTRIWLG